MAGFFMRGTIGGIDVRSSPRNGMITVARLAIALVLAFSPCLYADSAAEAVPSVIDKAERLRVDGKPLDAIKLLDEALVKDPDNIDIRMVRADCSFSAGEDRKAIADYEHTLKLKPSPNRKVIIFNNLAYILAASPDDKVRDGKRAVDYAETAQLLQDTPSHDVLDTLA